MTHEQQKSDAVAAPSYPFGGLKRRRVQLDKAKWLCCSSAFPLRGIVGAWRVVVRCVAVRMWQPYNRSMRHAAPLSAANFLSVVFVLRYRTAFRSDKYMGGAAHKLGLSLIGLHDPALSEHLHNHNGLLPLTISDLFQSDAHHHWMRITALRQDVAAALVALTEQPNIWRDVDVDGWSVVQALSSYHDWCGAAVPVQFAHEHWRKGSNLTLEFASPTSFRSVGLYRPLPEAGLVFKSLYERWCALVSVGLPFMPEAQMLEAFARDMVSIGRYDIGYVEVGKKGAVIPAFQGVVTYRIERDNAALAKRDPTLYEQLRQQHSAYASLLHLLARFSFYGGVGIKTAQGMGMARLLEAAALHLRP